VNFVRKTFVFVEVYTVHQTKYLQNVKLTYIHLRHWFNTLTLK